jgi:hypothetical protein
MTWTGVFNSCLRSNLIFLFFSVKKFFTEKNICKLELQDYTLISDKKHYMSQASQKTGQMSFKILFDW